MKRRLPFNSPFKETTMRNIFLKASLIIFQSSLFLSFANAQNIQVVGNGEVKDFEGNKYTALGNVISTEKVSDIDKITFSTSTMTINKASGSQDFNISDISKVNVSGSANKLDIFYPQSISNAFNFETADDNLLDADYSAGRYTNTTVVADTRTLTGSQGDITIEGDADVKIILDNATVGKITSTTSGKVYIVTTASSLNTVTSISATGDILLSGEGVLKITNTEDNTACIRSNSSITIEGGTLNLFNSGFAGQGIFADKNLTISRAAINVITLGDGTTVDTQTDFSTAAVAICAGATSCSSKEGLVTINSGKIRVKAIGGTGAAGIGAMHTIKATDATILISAIDDGLDAVDGVETNNCNIFVTSPADDAVGCKGWLTFRGGIFYAVGPYPNESAFDNNGKNFAIEKDITMIALGARGDAPMTDKTLTPCITIKYNPKKLYESPGVVTKKYIVIKSAEGKEVFSFVAPVYAGAHQLSVASPKFTKDAEYTICTTDDCTSGTELFGIITDGVFENLEEVTKATAKSK